MIPPRCPFVFQIVGLSGAFVILQGESVLADSFAYSTEIRDAVRNTPAGMPVAGVAVSDEYLVEAGEQARRRIIAAGIRLSLLLADPDDAPEARSAAPVDETTVMAAGVFPL